MSDAQKELTGPDLGAGVAARDLPDGGMLLGHFDGEAVLVARRGAQVFALEATCSHYGGPLAAGLFVGGTVRGPRHPPRFSFRTRGARGAPGPKPPPLFPRGRP